MKSVFYGTLVLCFMLIAVIGCDQGMNMMKPAVQGIIPDANLATAIREEIGNSITKQTLLNLTRLEAPNRGITNLTGLEHARNLQYLNLGDVYSETEQKWFNSNRISDLLPLAGLTQLTHLYLNDPNDYIISDITPLTNLTQLSTLYLAHNIISDITPLARLTQLNYLSLWNNSISDITPLAGLTQLTQLWLVGNPLSDASINTHIPAMQAKGIVVEFEVYSVLTQETGEKIVGPWLWVIAPTGNSGAGAAVSGIDFLSETSKGSVTELEIATNGATAGTPVGDSVWTPHTLSATDGNNINDMVNAAGLGTGDIDNHVAYGFIALDSPREQQTKMFAGSDDAVKVWLNGELVHNNPVDRGATGFQDQFPVTLKKGTNILLVAVYEGWGDWTGFFGFAADTEYTLILPTDSTPVVDPPKPEPDPYQLSDDFTTDNNGAITLIQGNAHLGAGATRGCLFLAGSINGVRYTVHEFKWQTRQNAAANWTDIDSDRCDDRDTDIVPIHGYDLNAADPGQYRAVLDITTTHRMKLKTNTVENYDIVPKVLVVDPDSPPIYWTDYGTDKIQRVDLDGSNVENLVTHGLTAPNGITLDVADGKMYWVDFGTDKIQRANLDGSNVEDLVTRGLGRPSYIALDVAGGKMYWTDADTNKIQRSDLDGSNVEDLVTRGLDAPIGLALDVSGGRMYWIDEGTDKIQRANLDGSNIEDLVTRGLRAPWGIALDVAGGKMYWTDWITEKIQRANLDGSDVEDLITSGLDAPGAIALDTANGKMYWTHTDWNAATQTFTNGKIQRANLDGTEVQDIITGLDVPDGIALGIPSQTTPSAPDLVVEAVRAEPATVAPGEKFKLYATLKNSGTAESAATTLRYYRSTDNVISTADTQLARADREPLAVNATIRRYLNVTAPTDPGTYYYGVCVDSVTDESNTDNNCSGAVSVTVTTEIPVTANTDQALLMMYWTDAGTDKIRRANLDGSDVQDLVTQGLESPNGIALDVVGGKMYWTDWDTGQIRRANLDGSNIEEVIRRAGALRGIALDVSGGKMYWTNPPDKIRRANLDGSDVQDLVTQGLESPNGIALDVVGGKMYWTDFATKKIQRANLNGSNIEDLVTHGLDEPIGIALDVVGGKMYWTDQATDKIRRANLDGSNIEDLVTRVQAGDIALDVVGGKMYWTDQATDKIRRANLDGSNIEDLVTRVQAGDIALDVVGGKMYWTDFATKKIQRANLDGSDVQDLVTDLVWPRDIAIGLIPTVNPTPIAKEDVNRDGVVDVHDLAYVGLQYGQTGVNIADVNGDGVVNVDDFILVAAAVDAAAAAAAPAARAKVASHFTKAQLQGWLTEARASGNTSRTYQRGIAVIEQLLTLFTPEKTALLANYPNPFNPETWIPYQLSKPTDVTLTIYDLKGSVVRALDLGHQPAGMYQSRSRAAYWDGRNAVGEKVASGLYFYTLTAGDFTATRKMLIRK